MKSIVGLIKKISGFFTSGKAEAVLARAAALVPMALPIVEEIAALTPNRTEREIAAAFQRFAVPGAAQYLAAPSSKRGYVLLQLASMVLAVECPGVATYVLDTAVQLAVAHAKA